MDTTELKYIIEAALLAAGRPLDLNALRGLFSEENRPEKDDLRAAIAELEKDYEGRGIALREVASGYRIQVRSSAAGWLTGLWEERTPRYSRALLETLAIVAYRQPVTRGDVEDIRGVGVTTNIIRTLLERSWIRVVGFRDVPGKPAIYGTTKEFLDYFGLRRLDDLPPLADLTDLDSLTSELDLGQPPVAALASPEDGAEETADGPIPIDGSVGASEDPAGTASPELVEPDADPDEPDASPEELERDPAASVGH